MAGSVPTNIPPPASIKSTERLFLEKWILKIGCAVVPWFMLLLILVRRETGLDIVPTKWVFLCMLLPFIYYYPNWNNNKGALYEFGLYVLCFPYIACFFLLFKGRSFVGATCKSGLRFAGLLSTIFYFLLLPPVILAMLLAEDSVVSSVLAIVAVVFVELVLIAVMRWAANPMKPFAVFMKGVVSVAKWLNERLPTIQQHGVFVFPEPIQVFVRSLLLMLCYIISRLLILVVHSLIHRHLVRLFTSVFVGMYIVVILTYACIYYAMQAPGVEQYTDLPGTFLSCLSFSVSVSTTAPVSDVKMTGDLSRMIYACQLSCTFLLVSVFFAMFSTSIGYYGDSGKLEVEQAASDIQQTLLTQAQAIGPVTDLPGNPQGEDVIRQLNDLMEMIKTLLRAGNMWTS